MKLVSFPCCLLLVTLLAPPPAEAANACTYNDPTTSFGASYSKNQVSPLASSSCTGAATTASRLTNTSFGRSTITPRMTGDSKFLQRNTTASGTVPTFVMVGSASPETKQFPDTIIAPAGGGCNDVGTITGVQALERHLHRSWPLFGKTYYFGDYIANPPNDPTTVTTALSPYVMWAPYNPSQEYIYMDPANESSGGSQAYAWGPQSNGVTADKMHPLMAPGHAAGTGCSAAGLTGTDLANCNTCLVTKGYYLKDGATPGDLLNSVFTGSIVNDYPPAWAHLAWAFGFVLDFQLHDASNNPLMALVRDQWQSANSPVCPSAATPNHAGGNFEPTGSSNCSIAYPTYDWTSIQALGMTPVTNDMSNMEGGNNGWGSAARYGGSTTAAPATPAGDLMVAADALQTFFNGCSYCQTKAVLYIGFGIPCGEAQPAGLPAVSIGPCTGECNYVNPAAECSCSGTGTNWLPYVSNYLYSSSNIRTYFIGMGPHTGAMRRAAAEGKGKYFNATDVDSFHTGIMSVISDVIAVATSSATSTINAVQVSVAGQEELVPRFVASQTSALWEGHLFKYYMFSEFAGNCNQAGDVVPIPNPLHPVCNATCICPGGNCTGRWLMDQSCKLISPDSTGFLFKSTWNGTALVPTSTPALAVWDARTSMRSVNWYNRKVYAAIDTNGDGVIDYRDGDGVSPPGMFLITAGATPGNLDLSGGVSDAVADALAPYMGLDGTGRCNQVSSFLSAVGKVFPPGPPLRVCARVILNYMLGEDLANTQLLNPTDPTYLVSNRIFMLGDIFHSSPQDIGPPSSEASCNYNTRRCVSTLFNGSPTLGLPDFQPLATPTNVVDPTLQTSVPNSGNIDAYQAYYQDEAFGKKRPRVTLFGANDGQVHAIQTACFVGTDTIANKPVPGYWDGPGNTGCVAGSAQNGSELWAFVPPDLLPKLANLMGTTHEFFVDNTPMVRDIYAPDPGGVTTPLKRYDSSSRLTMDFKRIAILGEREGGTHWHGLDVTDPTAPQFRWTFPQPNTPDELNVGFSTGDWVPAAAPIVPIRLAAPIGVPGYPTYVDSTGGAGNAFQEKWVVLLPGGYDPYGVAGKRIYMLDAYTGKKIFQTQDNGTVKQAFSFAALPSAVAWGTNVNSSMPTYNKGFFDTAIVGDVGGQVWALRFNDVGQGYPAGLVNNWFLGRSFRQFSADDTGAGAGEYRMQHRNPIFQMAAVGRTDTGYLRAFVGTGDRANMSEPGLGNCSLYNPLACGKQQSVMTMATDASGAGNPLASGYSSFKGDLAATYTSTSTDTFAAAAAACAPVSTVMNACVYRSAAQQAATNPSPSEPQYACTNPSSSWSCSVKPISDTVQLDRLEVGPLALTPDPNGDLGYYNRQVAVNIFDNSATPRSLFVNTAAAATYDSRSLTEASPGMTNLFPGTFSPTTSPTLAAQATGSSAGFYFTYPSLDERTATNAVLLQNCLVWYTMQPGQACSSNADCPGTTCNLTTHECLQPNTCGSSSSAIPARTAYLYQINATDGSTNCGLTGSSAIRIPAPVNSFLVPPPPPQPLVSINSKGQLSFAVRAPVGQLSPQGTPGSGGSLPLSFFYTIEAPRELHQCRHPPQGGSATPLACY